MENQAALQRVRHHSLFHLKKAGANLKEMLWFEANYGHPCCITFMWLVFLFPPELITRISPLFLVDNWKCRDHTKWIENLKSYHVIQHTQLNLFQSSNAVSLLITAWRTQGCPQLAASCDTLTHRDCISASITLKTLQAEVIGLLVHFIHLALLSFSFFWLVGDVKG